MSPEIIGLIGLIVLLVLLALKMWVGAAMLLVSTIGIKCFSILKMVINVSPRLALLQHRAPGGLGMDRDTANGKTE